MLPRADRLAYGLLRDAHEAEDAVQGAIFKAWRAFARLTPQSSVQAWFLPSRGIRSMDQPICCPRCTSAQC